MSNNERKIKFECRESNIKESGLNFVVYNDILGMRKGHIIANIYHVASSLAEEHSIGGLETINLDCHPYFRGV
jgi:hypothetical protein